MMKLDNLMDQASDGYEEKIEIGFEENNKEGDTLEQIKAICRRRQEVAKKRQLLAQARKKIAEASQQALSDLCEKEKMQALVSAKVDSIMKQDYILKNAAKSRRINPTNDCFHIWHDGYFGTINGLRMGNLGGNVPWSEINAALGTAALLLFTLASRPGADFRFTNDIQPHGSFTKITVRPKRRGDTVAVYNLYSDDSFQLFGKRNFNTALNMLLQDLKDAGDSISSRDRTMVFPYPIVSTDGRSNSNLTIGGLGISYSYESGGEIWTRSLKYFLADLKWVTAFVTKNIDR